MDATIFRYDNAGHALGILPYDSATHDEALDGTDKLTVVSEVSPTKRDRLVWQDDGGIWHEHMVDSTKRKHGANSARTESTCSNSINELYGSIFWYSQYRLKGSVQYILNLLLQGERWTDDVCSDFGVVEIEVHNRNTRECIAELCELVHGEMETLITVNESGVIRRAVRIVRERGNKSVVRQFQYGRNVSSIMREVAADEVYTAVKGYGAKLLENDRTEYPLRISVEALSSLDLSRWGIPKGNGTFAHNYTIYTDSQCTDRTFLLKQCQSLLASVSKPLVRYEFDTADVGGLWSDVRLGDKVMCVDELFNPPLELIERVSQIRRNLKGRVQCRIAIGARPNPLIDQFKAAEKTSKKSTGNGSRISSRTPTTTRGAGYDGEGAAGIGDVPTPTVTEPSSIAVTTPPNKTQYYDGEKIDFTGIIVTLYNSNNSVYTDDWHPDGVAAFEELNFPIDVAHIGATGNKYFGTSDLETSREQPLVAYDASTLETWYMSGNTKYTVKVYAEAINGARVIVNNNGQINSSVGMGVWFISGEQGAIGSWKVIYYVNDKESQRDERTLSTSNRWQDRFTHDGKTVYWAYIGITTSGTVIEKNEPPVDGEYYLPNFKGEDAWTLIYGDIEQITTNNVPVEWTRQDGEVLSTSFAITAKPSAFKGEAWGGGEGIDVPASSGGGKF